MTVTIQFRTAFHSMFWLKRLIRVLAAELGHRSPRLLFLSTSFSSVCFPPIGQVTHQKWSFCRFSVGRFLVLHRWVIFCSDRLRNGKSSRPEGTLSCSEILKPCRVSFVRMSDEALMCSVCLTACILVFAHLCCCCCCCVTTVQLPFGGFPGQSVAINPLFF